MRMSVFCPRCSRPVVAEGEPGGEAHCPACGGQLRLPDACDVFISYAREDQDTARAVQAALSAAGVNCWLDTERLRVGDEFLTAIPDALAAVKAVVLVLSRAATRSSWVKRELATVGGRDVPIFPLKVEDFELPRRFAFILSVHQWEEAYRGPIANILDRLVARVRETLLAGPPAEPAPAAPLPPPVRRGIDPHHSPYVGPRPFPRQKADRFCGRDHEARELLAHIETNRVVLLYAPSGAGKSSLLNTLVRDGLDWRGLEVLSEARVGGALPDNVRAADVENVYTFSAVYGLDGAVPSPKCRLSESLALRRLPRGYRGRVVVFDQFEELFTQHPARFADRPAFFDDVRAALTADPGLRVVFAIRQEYLADILPLLDRLPPDCPFRRFVLNRLGPDGALAAVTGPAADFAEFAPGVAEEIVRQLNTIRVAEFDGTVKERRGEFVEMVHLQIVCERLWAALPAGLTRIEMSHVERAAGAGKSFGEFVANALDAFYADTVGQVADSEETRRAGGYSRELIQLGCVKFVTGAGTRTMVERKNGRVGRLPDWIAAQLERSHLLRVEARGGAQWYELSHDRLADPVAREIDRDVSNLLFAADLLTTVLTRVKDDRGGKLDGYFAEQRQVLAECAPFYRQVGLFEDEAEFVFRASLEAGAATVEWSRRLHADFPETRLRVLADALACPAAAVRAHAAALLGDGPTPELDDTLLRLALEDADAGVRRAALDSLAKLDRPALFDALADRLTGPPADRRNAVRAFAGLRVRADRGRTGPVFADRYRALPGGRRATARLQAWGHRFRDALSVLPYVFFPAVVLSAVTAGLFKWVPGWFGWALCQARPSMMAGLFHGVTAAVVWGGLIPLLLMIHRVVFYQKTDRLSALRPPAALAWGAAAGVLTGLIVTVIVAGVFDRRSLVTMGWISGDEFRANDLEFWVDLFFRTRYGWAYVITGCGMGVGMAVMGNGMRASGRFRIGDAEGRAGAEEFLTIVRRMMRLALRSAWALPLCLAAAGAVVMNVLSPGPGAHPDLASFRGRLLGTVFDCGSQLVGGYFAMVGVGFGVVLLTRGIQVEARKEEI